MSHDTKVGLGLGILLVGIASAFYFREQPFDQAPLPELESTAEIEKRLSESVAERRDQVSPLDRFEEQYHPDLELPNIQLDAELPDVVKNKHDSELVKTNPTVVLNEPRPIPKFDPEFEFLNEPQPVSPVSEQPVEEQVVTEAEPEKVDGGWVKSPLKKIVDPLQDTPNRTLATKPVTQLDSTPRELPPAAEMFSEDVAKLEASREADIPVELEPIHVDPAPANLSESSPDPIVARPVDVPNVENSNTNVDKPIEPVRDPRVIVPKRVRLNEPVARRSEESLFSSPRTPKNQRIQHRDAGDESKPLNPARIPQELPSLDGLEPLDPSR